MSGLIVHVEDLLLARLIKGAELAAGRSLKDTIKVRVHATPGLGCLSSNAEAIVCGAGSLAGLKIALIKVLEGGDETG